MGFELEIDGVLVPSKKWSGPGTLRTGYRGPEPGSREAGNANFTVYDKKILKPQNSLALSFDGVDDCVEVPDSPLLRFPAIMTVAFWLRRKSDPAGSVETILSKGGNGEYAAFQVASGISGGGMDRWVRFRQSTDGSTWQTSCNAGTSGSQEWTIGQWNCYVCINNGDNAKVFLNTVQGTPDNSPASGELWINNVPLTMGCGCKPSNSAKGEWADIELDEVRITPYAWSNEQVTAFYNGGRSSRQNQGERLRWHLDDGGGTARDEVSGLVGQVSGALWIPSTLAMPDEEDVLVKDKGIIIRKDGRERFGGVIVSREADKRTVQIEAKENSARMNDLDAGMSEVGGLANPKLYLYRMEQSRSVYGEVVHSVQAFEVAPEESLDGPPPYFGWEKEMLFDSFGYTRGPGSWANRRQRTMLWREESLATILSRVTGLSDVQSGPRIQTTGINAGGEHEQVSLRVRTASGEALVLQYYEAGGEIVYGNYRPWGMMTRTIEGTTYSFLWIHRDYALELYQLLNHGVAVPLGRLDFLELTHEFMRLQYHPLHSYFGPWMVPEDDNQPYLLSFFFAGGMEDFRQRALIWEVDLRQLRSVEEDRPFAFRQYVIEENCTDGRRKYVVPAGRSYAFTQTVHPLREAKSVRSGGRYENTGAGANIFWCGDLWPSEMAYDFRGASLQSVLAEISKLSGCEWWIERGVLRMERMDRAPRTVTVNRRATFEDTETEGDASKPYEGFSSSGVPLTEEATAQIAYRLTELSRIFQSRRRRVKFLPRETVEYDLGAHLILDGRAAGRLVVYECEAAADVMELEPLPSDERIDGTKPESVKS